MGNSFSGFDIENFGFFISVELLDRKTGYIKLFYLQRAEADKLSHSIFELFETYSLGSTQPIPQYLIESYTEYEIKYDPYFSADSDKKKILVTRCLDSNGDLTVTVTERVQKISISEYIEIRNRPMYFGFSLQ